MTEPMTAQRSDMGFVTISQEPDSVASSYKIYYNIFLQISLPARLTKVAISGFNVGGGLFQHFVKQIEIQNNPRTF